MRSALFWLFGASLAFLATAGAFLLLANFGTAPRANDPIPRSSTSEQGPQGPEFALNFSEERLEGLQRRRNQTLTLYLENKGESGLQRVDLELTVSSEDTTYPRVRRYTETVRDLAPGAVEAVDLTVDLSGPPPPVESLAAIAEKPGDEREILEAWAYAPGAPAVVKTAVISP